MTLSDDPELSALKDMHVGLFDLDGLFCHKLMSGTKAGKLAVTGYSFCDVIHAWDSAEQQWEDDRTYIDRPARIFPETLRRWPFSLDAGIVIADFTGDYGENSPRNQLLKQLARADAMGFGVTAAFEYEFFLLDETADSLRAKGYRNLEHFAKANRTYSLQSAAAYGDLFDGLRSCMETLDIGMDSLHTELGPGCFEAPLAVTTGIKAADDAALFRNFARAYFARNALTTVFMSKLSPDLSGQSGHFHISLRKGDAPAFADPDAPDGLSIEARHFLGGLLQLMPGTAQQVARRAGLPYSQSRLTADPAYNATLGARFLGEQIENFDGSYVLTFAAYNAGPRRAKEWIERFGDPRGKPIDEVVDWVERIPFTETRAYVQRIMENYQVYKIRLGAGASIVEDLRFGRHR